MNALPSWLPISLLLNATLTHADMPQPEVRDFRGFENTHFQGRNDWTQLESSGASNPVSRITNSAGVTFQ